MTGTACGPADRGRRNSNISGRRRTAMAANLRLRSLWRLRTFIRPYRGQMWLMLFSAGLGVAAGTIVPIVTMRIVNSPIADGNQPGLDVMVLLVLGLGFTEAVLIFGRRWIQSVAVLRVEAQIRDDLYAHLQRLPVAFHDRWQTGQPPAPATTALSTGRPLLRVGALLLGVD